MVRQVSIEPAPGSFMATIRGGKHDNHVHVFPLEDGKPPRRLIVPDGVLRLQPITDMAGRPIYVLGKEES